MRRAIQSSKTNRMMVVQINIITQPFWLSPSFLITSGNSDGATSLQSKSSLESTALTSVRRCDSTSTGTQSRSSESLFATALKSWTMSMTRMTAKRRVFNVKKEEDLDGLEVAEGNGNKSQRT